jgi:uncharacterized protein (DUF2252 family)
MGEVGPSDTEWGKARRAEAPREFHAELTRLSRDPVGLIATSNEGRDPELIPLRNARMGASPFAFLRGTAMIMNADLAHSSRSGFDVQCCGDAHVDNFGVFATPERRLVFDLNDFDETLPGAWEWDVKRLAVSVHMVATAGGATVKRAESTVAAAVCAYRLQMRRYARMPTLEIWYDVVDVDAVLAATIEAKVRRGIEDVVQSARRRTTDAAVAKRTHQGANGVEFRSEPPLQWRPPRGAEHDAVIRRVLDIYRASLAHERSELLARYRCIDIVRRVVGVGSVGLPCWLLLMQGPAGPQDLLVLQAKIPGRSTLEAAGAESSPVSDGERVVRGQRLMQSAGDPFLGWTTDPATGVDAYIRQLWDMKAAFPTERLTKPGLVKYAAACAGVLARAHARTGNARAIGAYLGSKPVFDRAVGAFATRYSATVADDYAQFLAAIADGRVAAVDSNA